MYEWYCPKCGYYASVPGKKVSHIRAGCSPTQADFTPGPWYSSVVGNIHDQGLVIAEHGGANIAVTYDNRDATLIAAAPDLYAALSQITGICAFADSDDGPTDWVLDGCRAALARARGEV
jgi:hypothetical protein